MQKVLTATTEKSKGQYYTQISTKLMDPTKSLEAYWSILNTITKKYLVFHQFIIETIISLILKRRLRSSTTFCTLVENTSKLPTDSFKKTKNLLSTISFTKDDVAKIIKNLNPNKVHGFDMTSIRMLKICGNSNL